MYIYFTGLILCLAVAPHPGLLDDALNAVPESDDDRLNQALILVDILKSEYLKLLRERSESVATTTDIVEQSTCAATTAYSSPIETSTLTREQNNTLISRPNTDFEPFRGRPHSPGPVYPWGWPIPGTTVVPNRFYEMMPQPIQPQYQNQFPLRRRPFRRNFPDYSYYYGPYRRSEYYDEHPEETATGIPEIVTSNTAAVYPKKLFIMTTITRLSPDTSRRLFYTHGRRSYNQNRRQSVISRQNVGITKPTETNTNIINGANANPNETNSNINGLHSKVNGTNAKTNGISPNGTITNIKTKVNTFKPKATTLASKEVWPAFRFKTTLRIFLEKSTPLPIPLPENNAFCFTNPNNALCRSP